jgi:hypothetical protein
MNVCINANDVIVVGIKLSQVLFSIVIGMLVSLVIYETRN